MKQFFLSLSASATVALLLLAPAPIAAQQTGPAQPSPALTWDQVKARFEAANPALQAAALGVDEMKAAEITAFLRPNPQVGLSSDGLQIAPHSAPGQGTHWQPLTGTQLVPSIAYLHERERKRELRLQSAKEGTQIAGSQHEDLERNLLFDLRAQFVQTLEAKAVLELAKADLAYYDNIIAISRNRLRAGDIAQIDLDRIELFRVQYEMEIQTAIVNLRTSKIQLLQLLNERTPVEQFDVTGTFDFTEDLKPLEEFRQIALDARPDLRAALESIVQAQTNHKLAVANGSADPTWSVWYTYNPAFNNP
jgi:cobalt-zinc-cadmium efflux system outer membrane protein